uniref:Uncharacterized protein n=1 Tax=Thermogemmatispora argillosa TaxID=2045280 RepID=A0A455T7H9_9CHLR|nr:hypothetical protein KTA_33630 [Thermogemmatispora argillosa]
MNTMQYLAERARAVYEEETERQRRARQAARAAEEAERHQAEQQAQKRCEQLLGLLHERYGLPEALCAWMRRKPGSFLCLQVQIPEPFGCADCDWELSPSQEREAWYVQARCKRLGLDITGRLQPESLSRWLLFRLEASRRMHERWQELVAEEQAARAELAQREAELEARACAWPEGQTLTLYQVHYVRGVAATEDGEHWLEASGWCRADQPDADGYLRLEPTADGPERLLKLDPNLHRPLFERHEFTSPAELPWELTELCQEQIRGFRWQQAHGRSWLVRDPAESVSFSFRVPLPWVRELLAPCSQDRHDEHA